MLTNQGITTAAIALGSALTIGSSANAITLKVQHGAQGLEFISRPAPSEEAPATALSKLKVTVENIAPQEGLIVSRMWIGFHNGSFDVFDFDEPATIYLERLAEDAITEPTNSFTSTLTTAFADSGAGEIQGTILGLTGLFNDFYPGDRADMTFTLDASLPTSRYFSYAAMGLPSNDAFIANNNPFAIKIFDESGSFLGADFIVTGNEVWDAGTEVNDEIPENTAALAQAAPNTGITENGVVAPHPGFMADGNNLQARPNADFTAPDYQIARITVEQIPEPTAITGLLVFGGYLSIVLQLSKSKGTL